MPAAPAFKEWQAIVGARLAGEQILILRKGGIAEPRDGFSIQARRFWLFPTAFHAQREKTKAAVHRYFAGDSSTSPNDSLTLSGYADVAAAAFLDTWDDVARLDWYHGWTESTVRERFNWSRPPGLHALVVRAYRLHEPRTVPLTPEMAGCKSWLEVPVSFDAVNADPVLTDNDFASRVAELKLPTNRPT